MKNEIKLLHINNYIADNYRKFVKGKEGVGYRDIRKYLTRNFILGNLDLRRSNDIYQLRRYGNLSILVNVKKGMVIDIYNKKGGKHGYINTREKEDLNKLLEIGDEYEK
ncbi:hypothetical protein [Clostridium sardiniense]|uniref:hypothetical protein n=1 Tax=Clostridium sardiniense TaxID=29369 RepID=UPI0019565AFD|nr:hypothetical protein [Clostridium sardiniense]MBM7836317.1 hypothetical protein [Clostridium sardiniense]